MDIRDQMGWGAKRQKTDNAVFCLFMYLLTSRYTQLYTQLLYIL